MTPKLTFLSAQSGDKVVCRVISMMIAALRGGTDQNRSGWKEAVLGEQVD